VEGATEMLGSGGGGIERGVVAPRCTPVCCMGGGGGGLPSAISAASWTWCETRLDLDIGGCGDMVGWMPMQLVSGSFGCGATNIEAKPRCNINIQYIHTLYICIIPECSLVHHCT
jgi:hypothetical protein